MSSFEVVIRKADRGAGWDAIWSWLLTPDENGAQEKTTDDKAGRHGVGGAEGTTPDEGKDPHE